MLHIVQGGVDNGDKVWLERAVKRSGAHTNWVVPKSVAIGDDIVIYVQGYGFFATAVVKGDAVPRDDRDRRYGADISGFKLMIPPISLASIKQGVPSLAWTRYPRSITTPKPQVSARIKQMVKDRLKYRGTEVDPTLIDALSLDELRILALRRSTWRSPVTKRIISERKRIDIIKRYALLRSRGICESCRNDAPFRTERGSPYLEAHHITNLANEGPDHPAHVIAVCPNCHRRAHYGVDRGALKAQMKRRVTAIERRRHRVVTARLNCASSPL